MRTAILALSGAALLLAGCETDEATRTVELQVGGDAGTVSVAWREGGSTRQELGAELPWIHAYEAREGDAVTLVASTGSSTARLWARVLEDGEEVVLVPGCLCNGAGVSTTVEGIVGHWDR